MGEIVSFNEARETKRSTLEKSRDRWTVELGSLAIERCEISINDPVIHLCDYIKRGDESLAGIKEDIETTTSERLKNKEAFIINKLQFNFDNSDFISVNDNVSMRTMTKNNLETWRRVCISHPELAIELARAQVEMEEVEKLVEWFVDAPIGANFVVESPPIGAKEEYAFNRIFRKLDEKNIEGGFFTLHNSSVQQFNDMRAEFGISSDNKNNIDILRNCYEINEPDLEDIDEAIEYYVGVYDQLLYEKTNKKFRHGIEIKKHSEIFNGLEKVKQLSGVTNIYLDAIKLIENSDGVMTSELSKFYKELKLDINTTVGQKLTTKSIRNQLNLVIKTIASSVDNADKETIAELTKNINNSQATRDTASHFGQMATANGLNYESLSCPEFNGGEEGDSTGLSDEGILSLAFGSMNRLKNFGQESFDVCRIGNCPSRGEISWLPNKTKVGGCKVCVGCHIIFQKGKNPEQIYKQQNKIKVDAQRSENERKDKNKRVSKLTARQNEYKKRIEDGDSSFLTRYEKATKELAKITS